MVGYNAQSLYFSGFNLKKQSLNLKCILTSEPVIFFISHLHMPIIMHCF